MHPDAATLTSYGGPLAVSSSASLAKMAAEAAARAAEDRRRRPRYLLTKTAVAIPVSSDFCPHASLPTHRLTCDISESGIGFDVPISGDEMTELMLLGIEADDGDLHFATIEVRHVSDARGGVRVGGSFVSDNRDLLCPDKLMPTFRVGTNDYSTGLPPRTLNKWVELGIFRPMLVDRVYVCPDCGGMPSVRSGCRSCGSIHIATNLLLHHFSCCYVGRATEFHRDGDLRCPKCRQEGLVLGEGVQQIDGPYHCMNCNWSDTATDVFGHCVRCQHRFPLHKAAELDLIGYHVNRLDPQALLNSAV